METRTAHGPDELTFLDCDDRTSTVAYTAPSATSPGTVNTVVLDVLTLATACDCGAGRRGRPCWHRAHILAAWEAHPAAYEARFMTSEQLLQGGVKARRMVAVYRHRTWNTLLADRLALLAARAEWRRRHPVAVPVAAGLPPAA
jgi:hypothetical protein